MNRSIKILKGFNDIDNTFLLENFESKEKNLKRINIFKEVIKHINVKYVASTLSTIGVMCIFILYIIYINGKNNVNSYNELAEENVTQENITENVQTQEDNIIFNKGSIKNSTLDIAGKMVYADLISEFDFLNDIMVPDTFKLSSQGKLYVKENINDENFTKLRQYSLWYSRGETNTKQDFIEIIFTKDKTILACMLPDENNFVPSTINEKEVKLFKIGKVSEAFFEYDGYKFYIEANEIEEAEFINLLKSILK